MEFSDIKGLGQKKAEALSKAGFNNPADLLFFFPKSYIDTNSLSRLDSLKVGADAVFFGSVISLPVRKTVRRGLFFVRAEFLIAGENKVSCIWFNNAYIKNMLKPGKTFYIAGKVKKSGSRIELSSPELYEYEAECGIIPVYRRISGFSQNSIRNIIREVADRVEIRGFLSRELADEFSLLPLSETVKVLHNPSSIIEAERARKSATLEMLSCDLAVFFLHKDTNCGIRAFRYEKKSKELNELINKGLPYKLTNSQLQGIERVTNLLTSGERMNMLLQGDVGSGKTIVAFLSAYFACLNGYQSVLMAPTEILARQHYENAEKLLGCFGVRICLLTGSQSKNERLDKLFNIKSGLYDFIIGTHALIQDDVEFFKLSLVITDEQQRFGVGQRGKLENKADTADCLILSATPIPRTLSLVLYGELQQMALERIKTKRATTLTRLVPIHKIEDMFSYVAKKAEGGEKTYIVCPRLEEDEDDALYSAKQLYKELKKRADIEAHLTLLHGQMKEEEKNRIMDDFSSGKSKIMVATTVIEVGIDVSDATTIIILNPERFGLSQLHQLRGRVGRGELDSYCFLVTNDAAAGDGRLEFFLGCDDGFALAEYDFESRGAGDFLGTRQHGGAGISGCRITLDMLADAKNIAQRLINNEKTKSEIFDSINLEKIRYIKNLSLS